MTPDEFFKGNKNKYAFASNFFGQTAEAKKFIKKLESMGAKVEIDGIYDEPYRIKEEGGMYADTLIVSLPKTLQAIPIIEFLHEQNPDEYDHIDAQTVRVWWD